MKNKYLLAFLALLMLLKFGVFPIVEWQDGVLLETIALQKKIDKSESYINNLPEMMKIKDNRQNILNNIIKEVNSYSNVERYQLNIQKDIEKLFSDNNLVIKSTIWKKPVIDESGAQLELNIQFSGKVKDYISTQSYLFQNHSTFELNKFGLSLKNQTENSLGIITSGNMVVLIKAVEDSDANI